MTKQVTFICGLLNGVHARPASHIERVCNRFQSRFHWYNPRSGIVGDGKSVLSLIAANILLGDECQVTIEGEDEQVAFERLSILLSTSFHTLTPSCRRGRRVQNGSRSPPR